MDRSLKSADWIGRRVSVVVDRPLGSRHPDDPSFVYEVNYGLVPGTMAPDGEPLDALGIESVPEEPSSFSLENGAEQLEIGFGEVATHTFEDKWICESPKEFTGIYENMGRYRMVMADDNVPRATRDALLGTYRKIASGLFKQDGRITSRILLGAFVCHLLTT